jgi:glycosyltransferase involved in cell wall biosynthesis
LIEEGTNGMFLNPLDPVSMRDTTLRMLDDPAMAAKLAELAKERAKERYHPQVIATRHVEIYREVLNKPS